MGINIQQLSPELANQIAAGEVVERPASIVKELLENAADAKATNVRVSIGYGGLNAIVIEDNGQGIVREDLALAVAPHATSKIEVLNDLYCIQSMGFRGEALASIASVSRLSITSKPQAQSDAYQLSCREGKWRTRPCARDGGTTVSVMDIFYNAPVRKKFLKSAKSEFLYIEQVVKRFALAQPQIAITLEHDDKTVLQLPAAKQRPSLFKRVEKILGKPFFQSAIDISCARANMRIHGWVSALDFQRSQPDKQFVYVNQRMVRDKLLMHAFKQAYEGQLHPGRHPACVLYIELPSEEVDVNVHPTKHELRFTQPRLVHDFIFSSIKERLPLREDSEDSEDEVMLSPRQAASFSAKTSYFSSPLPKALTVAEHSRALQKVFPVEGAFSFHAIGEHYGLLQWDKAWWMCQTHRFQLGFYQWHLAQLARPLQERPLLLPIEQVASHALSPALAASCRALGLKLTSTPWQDAYKWSVQTIPVAFPQIDVKRLLEQLRRTPCSDPLPLFIESLCSETKRFDEETLDALQAYLHAQHAKGAMLGLKRLDDNTCEALF